MLALRLAPLFRAMTLVIVTSVRREAAFSGRLFAFILNMPWRISIRQ